MRVSSREPNVSGGGAAQPPRSGGLGLLLVLAAWIACFEVLGRWTFGYGWLSFPILLLVFLILAVFAGRAGSAAGPISPRATRVVLALVFALSGMRLGFRLVDELATPGGDRRVLDIASNTYVAGSALLEGKNPYATRAQLWHVVGPGSHVTVENGRTEMFGLPYDYGYPYFPAMFLSYLPARWNAAGSNSLRVVNALLLAASGIGLALLARRLAPRPHAATAALAAVAALVAPSVLAKELFRFAITDLVIATFAVWAFVALARERPLLGGALFGLAQSAKLLPGPLLVLPVLVWLWRRPGFARVVAGYAGASAVVVLPFVLWDPARFLSSTVLYYLTYHAPGDNTSYWYFLPDAFKLPFRVTGLLLTALCVAWTFRRRREDLLAPLSVAFLSYLLFVAFNNMIHLNYLWGIYPLGCAALAIAAVRGRAPRVAPTGGAELDVRAG